MGTVLEDDRICSHKITESGWCANSVITVLPTQTKLLTYIYPDAYRRAVRNARGNNLRLQPQNSYHRPG